MELPSLQTVYIATTLLRKCSSQVPWLLSNCLLEVKSNIHSKKTGSEPQLCHLWFCLYLLWRNVYTNPLPIFLNLLFIEV